MTTTESTSASDESADQSTLVIYGHETCPMVMPVRAVLDRYAIPYDYINIHKDRDAAARVRDINAGNESVPTLVFPDGSTLTEPSSGELVRALAGLGYAVSPALARATSMLPIATLIGGAVGGLLLGGVLGDAGLGLIVGTGLAFIANMVLFRIYGA